MSMSLTILGHSVSQAQLNIILDGRAVERNYALAIRTGLPETIVVEIVRRIQEEVLRVTPMLNLLLYGGNNKLSGEKVMTEKSQVPEDMPLDELFGCIEISKRGSKLLYKLFESLNQDHLVAAGFSDEDIEYFGGVYHTIKYQALEAL